MTDGKLFISYSHLDRERIDPYIDEMKRQSISFWFDADLHVGENFSDEIAQSILNSTGFTLFLSNNSTNSWYVREELTYARNKYKRVVVIHLDPDIKMPEGMELLLGSLHHMTYPHSVVDCIHRIDEMLQSDGLSSARPVTVGKLNHTSELLIRCRQSFEHIYNQMGVRDIEKDIDPKLFCPIYSTREKDKAQRIELYSEICRDDHTHILLQADGGLGKTYTFLHTMKRLLDCDRPCAYIPCHLFNETREHPLGLILEKLCQICLPSGSARKNEAELNEYFRSQTDKTFILFLDGFNEAVAKTQLSSEIVNLSNMFSGIKIVVSTRYGDAIFASYANYTMHGLNRSIVGEILSGYGQNYSKLSHSLRELLLTPMFLCLYVRMGKLDREIDTAAELMDQERQRILNSVKRSGLMEHIDSIEECLNEVFPDFVRQEYRSSSKNMSFLKKRLEDYLQKHLGEPTSKDDIFDFLTKYSIILKSDDNTNRYTLKHEHFRDYWVAFSILQELLQIVEGYTGAERANAIADVLLDSYSQIVLQFVGELAQLNHSDNVLYDALNALRRNAVQDDKLWLSNRIATTTSKTIGIYKRVQEDSIIGMNLDGLNLSITQLNQVRTCKRDTKATFRDSLITEQTFIVSLHESAPRRVEILCLEDKRYLVTISNYDLLISSLPELEVVWRYPHLDDLGNPISTHSLTTSVRLGSCVLAVDDNGDVWEWDFVLKDGIPSVLPLRRHEEAAPAVKVIPWSDDEGPLIALQREDGTILQYYADEIDEITGITALTYSSEMFIAELAHADTRKTLTSSQVHSFLCWAVAAQDDIQVWKYDVIDHVSHMICAFPAQGLIPDYMICVGSEQSSRKSGQLDFGASDQDDSMVILTAIHKDYTRVYQINLPRSRTFVADCIPLKWHDGTDQLANDYIQTQRPFNRINAMSFSDGKMLMAANDGCLYLFKYDLGRHRFVPNPVAPRVRLSSMAFAIEDVLFISKDMLAAVSVDRSVHLIEADSLFLRRKLKGYNDGLRQILSVNPSLALATSYDGCVLELHRNGNRFICHDKLPVGNWCWSLEKISASVCAVGYLTGIALVDITRDRILSRKEGYDQKIEHLLYIPEAGSNILIAASKSKTQVYTIWDDKESLRLEDMGKLSIPENYSCYWLRKSGKSLMLSISGKKEDNPCIAWYSLESPLCEQTPTIMNCGSKFGRIRDIHMVDRYLMVSNLTGDDGEAKSSRVCFFDASDRVNPTLVLTISGFPAYIVHSDVHRVEEGCWRVAIIDQQARGMLYQYVLRITGEGALFEELVSKHAFPARLCDVAFDENGDLLITGLNGCLYGKTWLGDSIEMLFRNKSDMLTFGADLSRLYHPVNSDSFLGRVLTDFGNRLKKGRR